MEKFPSRERSAAQTLQPRVSAIVVVRRLKPTSAAAMQLDLCLRSVLAEPWTDELIVVDLDNEPDVSSKLRAFQADRRDVKLVVADRAASIASALNAGANQARGRWLLFLSADVVLQRGSVQRLASAGAEARTPCVVGGRLTDMRGRDRRAVRAGALNAFSAIAVAMDLPSRSRRKRKSGGMPASVSAVSSALMLMPRSDFLALEGFDESFATDGADLDLCRRAALAGGSVLFQPSASGVQFERDQRGRRKAQGLARFASKSARTPLERLFALVAEPALASLLALRDFVAGRPPLR
ncbi:MAG: glycosyltransferase [Hyphomonadaceae bacterium]|nr:glycosyltransferase [Hyphomonadaceae bacterium]GIK47712.1 MAG: glycosyl transferase [Alphaproteobacteria bacterium]